MTDSPPRLRVAVAQIDTTVGDFEGNAAKILELGRRAEGEGAHLVLFPELAVCGYPPRDLVERPAFVAASERTTERLARASRSALWIFGSLWGNRAARGRRVFNTAVAARDGRRVAIYRKRLLPTYDVFDEGRYVEPGDRGLTLRLRGRRVAVTICEDIWNDKTFWKGPLYPTDPVAELVRGDADLHVNISASPYTLGKNRLRRRMMSRIARRSGVPLVHCNLVGGNDGLVFDGASTAFDAQGRLTAAGKRFEEDFWTIDLPDGRGPSAPMDEAIPGLRRALVLALRDYAAKCGFRTAVLGLSGRHRLRGDGGAGRGGSRAGARPRSGDAGPVLVGGEPSRRGGSGAAHRHPLLGGSHRSRVRRLPRDASSRVRLGRLDAGRGEPPGPHPGRDPDGALEPVRPPRPLDRQQVGDRRRLLHALRRHGRRLRPPLGRAEDDGLRARRGAQIRPLSRGDGERIPRSTIEKPPSAELRPNQKDTDSLPPYDVLDPLIEALVDRALPPERAARAAKVPVELARDIARRIDAAEYKRFQMPPGPKVTARGFGEGRRYPIAQKFRP